MHAANSMALKPRFIISSSSLTQGNESDAEGTPQNACPDAGILRTLWAEVKENLGSLPDPGKMVELWRSIWRGGIAARSETSDHATNARPCRTNSRRRPTKYPQ